MLLLNLRDSLPLLTQQPIEIAMTFTFTQQIESTQNQIAQLNQKLDLYSQTDEYITQSENLLRSVTELFEDKDLQIVRSRLQDLWSIENKYDTTAEIEFRDTKIVELQRKIKSLEANLEMVFEQRDRSNEKYNELLRKQITGKNLTISPGALVQIECRQKGEDKTWNGLPAYVQEVKGEKAKVALQGDYREKWFSCSSLNVLDDAPNQREEEFLDELEPPVTQVGEELESCSIEVDKETGECVEATTPEEDELLHKFLAGINLDWKDYDLLGLVNELGLSPVFPQNKDAYLRAIHKELKKRGYQIYDQPPAPAPIDLRVKNFIKSFKDDETTWEDLKGFALNDPKFFQKLTMARSKKLGRIKEALPKMLASHIQEHGRKDKTWVGKTLWGLAEKELKTRYQQAKNTPELTVEDAVRAKTLDWECEVKKVVDDLLKPQSFNSVMVKRITGDLFARYPDNLEAIASKLFELLASNDCGCVVYVWVEDTYKEYQKNTLVAA